MAGNSGHAGEEVEGDSRQKAIAYTAAGISLSVDIMSANKRASEV